MANKGTSKKQESSLSAIKMIDLKTKKGLSSLNTKKYLSNHNAVLKALMESLKEGDVVSFKEILSSYLEVVNKTEFAKEAGIAERTLFRMLTPDGNPTLDNVAKVIHVLSKAS